MRHLVKSTILSIPALLTPLSADANNVITLNNGDTLTGKITNSQQKGVYELIYKNSKHNLKIKEESISSISFSDHAPDKGLHTEKIVLINDDQLPCKLQSFDKENITFSSDYMGTHSVPKKMIKRIYFNNKPQDIIYEGPGKDISSWKTKGESFKLINETLTTGTKAKISRSIKDLPENFQLDFTVAWTGNYPRIRVYFCAHSTDLKKNMEHYYFDMNALEFRITHYAKRRFQYQGFHTLTPRIYNNSKGKISLYVHRKKQTIILYYNNKKIKEFKHNTIAPRGSGLVFHTFQPDNKNISISNIKIKYWDGHTIQDEAKNKNLLANNDIITDTNGNPMTGNLLGIEKQDKKLVVNFKLPFANNPASIPISDIQFIDLQRDKASASTAKTTRKISLIHGGAITYNNSQMIGNKVSFTHPILGEVSVNQNSISHLKKKALR